MGLRRFDYFSGAPEDWRERAKRRSIRLLIDHGTRARDYADKRIGLTPWGSFERRRWNYIRRLIDKLLASDFPIPAGVDPHDRHSAADTHARVPDHEGAM